MATRAQTPALLKGLIFDVADAHPQGGRLYRYYVSQDVLKQGRGACPVGRLPAADFETAVIEQVRHLLRSPEVIVATWRAGREYGSGATEDGVRAALTELDPLWDELFPAEQARIVQLLIERVDVGTDGIRIQLELMGSPVLSGPSATTGNIRRSGVNSAAMICADGGRITVLVPLTIRKWGGRKVVVAPTAEPAPEWPQARKSCSLVNAVVRAHRWMRESTPLCANSPPQNGSARLMCPDCSN